MFLSNFHYSVLTPQNIENPERIVFVHGLMAFSANWRKIASRMQDQYECLIYDQRGHGRSFKPETGYTLEDFAQDLNKITDELGWTQFHLVGHSMGGRTAMVFASLFPEKVKTLTLEDIGPEIDPKAEDYYRRMLGSVPTPFANKEAMKTFFAKDFASTFVSKEQTEILALFLQSNIEEAADGVNQGLYDWKFSKDAIIEIVHEAHKRDRWEEYKNLKTPILLIRGENSHVLTHETFEKMLQSNPNTEGVEIKQTGHWVHFEKYQEFLQYLREFIGKHP